MNNKLRREAKYDFQINFEETMKNVKKHWDIKLVTTDKVNINIIVKINKQVYLGFSILEIRKPIMYKFWYDYITPKYQNNAELCYMDTDSFLFRIKTDDVYKDIADDG